VTTPPHAVWRFSYKRVLPCPTFRTQAWAQHADIGVQHFKEHEMAKEWNDTHLNLDLFTEASSPHLMAAAHSEPAVAPVRSADSVQENATLPCAPPEDLIRMLNHLLVVCHDGAYGFADCAEHAQSDSVRNLLLRQADECRMAALEVRAQVKSLHGEPEEGGTTGGALHRGWVSVRGTLTGFPDEFLLDECERAQDELQQAYRDALQVQCPQDLLAVLRELQRHAQHSHALVKSARDAERMRAHAEVD
jgi:uncharacterized protein (TIGR02284 family)